MSSLLVICTAPDEPAAAGLARALVEERLAACVSRLPGLRSTFRWQGALREESEVLLLIKTTAERYGALQARIVALHPYDVPELIAFAATGGLPAYLGWIAAECAPA